MLPVRAGTNRNHPTKLRVNFAEAEDWKKDVLNRSYLSPKINHAQRISARSALSIAFTGRICVKGSSAIKRGEADF